MTTQELCDQMDINLSSVSRNLTLLRNEGLVTGERRGKPVYFSLVPERIEAVISNFSSVLGIDGQTRRPTTSMSKKIRTKKRPRRNKSRRRSAQ